MYILEAPSCDFVVVVVAALLNNKGKQHSTNLEKALIALNALRHDPSEGICKFQLVLYTAKLAPNTYPNFMALMIFRFWFQLSLC